jgi:hypothetical protein
MASATVGHAEFGVGGELAWHVVQKRLTTANAAAWWITPDSQLVLRHRSLDRAPFFKPGEFALSYFRSLNKEAAIGGEFAVNAKTDESSINFGGKLKVDPQTTIRAKLDSLGKLGLSYTRKPKSWFKFTLASTVNLNKSDAFTVKEYQFGIHLKFSNAMKKLQSAAN